MTSCQDAKACHRLANRAKVICKMVSRKRMREVIKSRKKLHDRERSIVGKKIFSSESLPPAYSTIDFYARHRKKRNIISACWFFNGSYTVVVQQEGKKHRIGHVADLESVTGMPEEDIIDICPAKRF